MKEQTKLYDDECSKDERITLLENALAYAIKEADGWLFEARGIDKIDTVEMDKARGLLK